jgi:DNA polymerase III delta subunit
MVIKEKLVYLFLGQDIVTPDGLSRKDTTLKKIKEDLALGLLADFNLDFLYARGLKLEVLQERILSLPVKSKKRMLVIREAQNLEEDIKKFILEYVKKPFSSLILVLDVEQQDQKDTFVKNIYNYVQVFRFREQTRLDVFTLGRFIELKKPESALRILNQLLEKGEKPEWILNGLRYSLGRNIAYPQETRKRLKLMLNCDIDIKMGRLKPVFALEKLVVSLSSFSKPFS